MKKEIVNIQDYIELHNRGLTLDKVQPIGNQTYQVLKNSNVDVRIIDREKNTDLMYKLPRVAVFSKDTAKDTHRYFYSIPLQTVSGTIVGFIYRTVFGKAYSNVSRNFTEKSHKVPFMFGFYKDFEDFDSTDYCKPIIICEGLKDCITLKQIYPYVLSNNTSHMGLNLSILSKLTNKFILVYDTDSAGQEGMEKDVKNAQEHDIDVLQLSINGRYKDVTDLSENKVMFDQFRRTLLESIKSLEAVDGMEYTSGRIQWGEG